MQDKNLFLSQTLGFCFVFVSSATHLKIDILIFSAHKLGGLDRPSLSHQSFLSL